MENPLPIRQPKNGTEERRGEEHESAFDDGAEAVIDDGAVLLRTTRGEHCGDDSCDRRERRISGHSGCRKCDRREDKTPDGAALGKRRECEKDHRHKPATAPRGSTHQSCIGAANA